MNQDDIQLIFLQDCDEGLASAEIALIACHANPEVSEAINSIFRAVRKNAVEGKSGCVLVTGVQAWSLPICRGLAFVIQDASEAFENAVRISGLRNHLSGHSAQTL